MGCNSCKRSDNFHKKCVRCSSCWLRKLYQPDECNVCKENFATASQSEDSPERVSVKFLCFYLDLSLTKFLLTNVWLIAGKSKRPTHRLGQDTGCK